MFPCLGNDRWFPLTSQVGFFHAPVQRVTRRLPDFTRGARDLAQFTDLDAAITGLAPHAMSRGTEHTVFLLPSASGTWTTVLDSGAPAADVGPYLSARAALDVHCDFVAAEWTPRAPGIASVGAQFLDYQHRPEGLLRRTRHWYRTRRTVQVTRQEHRWTFDAIGPVREYEETGGYSDRTRARRLPLDLIARCARAAGIAVDDPGWLDGPVYTATRRRPRPHDDPPTWSTAAELRALCGYPPTGVPEEL